MTSVRSSIRLLREDELEQAFDIVAIAFSEQLGLPDPSTFGNGATCSARWYMDPESVFLAEEDGEMAGVAFATAWGSFGFFGPLCVLPKFWNRKIGQKLLEPVMDYFHKRGVQHAALFTFANSVKHIRLYEKFGFYPRYLTALASKSLQVSPVVAEPDPIGAEFTTETYAQLAPNEATACLDDIRTLTNAILPGLDLSCEIQVVAEEQIGDTLVLRYANTGKVAAFAVCHFGERSEAERGTMYVKFAAARPTESAQTTARSLDNLLIACEAHALSKRLNLISVGVNTGRTGAYQVLQKREYIEKAFGIAMHRPNAEAFSNPASFVLDDLR
jgi:GNAT superfamily N-acetyltransferase